MAAQQTHKALTLPALGQPLELRTVPTPEATAGSAVVRILASPLWPSVQALLTGADRSLSFPTPIVPGPRAVGRVESVGPDAAALRAGQLVMVDPYVLARDDPRGHQILLGLFDGMKPGEKKLAAGSWRDGCFAERARVPLENCVPLDEKALAGYSPSMLCQIGVLAVPYGGFEAVHLKPGQTVIIAPATGMYSGAAVHLASSMGARVIALGRSEAKLAKLKATNLPRVDTVTLRGDIDADAAAIRDAIGQDDAGAHAFLDLSPPQAGDPPHIRSAMRCLRPGGRVAFMAMLPEVRIEAAIVMFKGLTIKGQYMYSRDEIRHVAQMVEAGVVKLGEQVGQSVAGEFKLEEWEQALKTASENGAPGQMVTFVP